MPRCWCFTTRDRTSPDRFFPSFGRKNNGRPDRERMSSCGSARPCRLERKRPMRDLRLHAVAACVAALVVWGCGKEESAPAAPKKVAEEKIPPSTYPAPAKEHL